MRSVASTLSSKTNTVWSSGVSLLGFGRFTWFWRRTRGEAELLENNRPFWSVLLLGLCGLAVCSTVRTNLVGSKLVLLGPGLVLLVQMVPGGQKNQKNHSGNQKNQSGVNIIVNAVRFHSHELSVWNTTCRGLRGHSE